MRRIVPSLNPTKVLPLVLALLVTACSVFGPVGDVVSQGYENTVSYFNAYYNAKRLYDEAEEEVITHRLNQRGQRTAQGPAAQTVPAQSRTKFTQVIEKCSGILSDHETSSLVDDALLLIGKSYYYQNEFLKAERKFEELYAKDPQGAMLMETQLWLLRCLVETGRREEGLQLGVALHEAALEEGEDDIAGQALLVLARLTEETDPSASLSYLGEAVTLLEEDLDQGTAQAKIGDQQMAMGQTEEAIDSYLEVLELTSDTYLRFYGLVHAARAYGALGRYDEALELADELLDDYSFMPYWNEIRFEVAEAKARLGRLEEAIDDFTFIDTSAVRTEYGTRAAFRKGWILEHDFGDYAGAQLAYGRASAYPVAGVSNVAKQRGDALAKHRTLHQKFAQIDSMLALLSETPAEPPDSAASVRAAPNPDSLRALTTAAQFELGELFYSELELPDSALHYYNLVLDSPPDSNRTPRTLFIMADLARSQSLDISSDSLYRVIVRDYPSSPYALAAKEALGIPLPKPRVDPARALYADAEEALEKGNHLQAIEMFDRIVVDYPESEFAIRSRYAVGWIYEYVLDEPDSALTQYRMLVADYGSSPFADRVRQKVGAAEPEPAAPTDSVLIERIEKVEAPRPDRRPVTEEEAPPESTTRRGQASESRTALPPRTPPPKKED